MLNSLFDLKLRLLSKLINRLDEPGEWRYHAPAHLYFRTAIFGRVFKDDYISIAYDGRVTVFEGAPSDGCTPKFLVFGLFYVGTPDGPYDSQQRMPVTGRAFFLHDHLLRVRDTVGIKASVINNEFCKELYLAPNFWYKKPYCNLVRWLGPRD